MNILDLLIVALLALAIVHGVTQGAAMQVLSFGGFWGGLAIGAIVGPPLSMLVDGQSYRAFVSLVSLFGLAAIGGGMGRQLGTHAWSALRRMKLGHFDSLAGAAIAMGASLVAVWLFAVVMSGGPIPEVARAINDSRVARGLVEVMPTAPSVLSRVQALVNTTPFPKVFAGFEPSPDPVAVPDDPTVQAAVNAAGASTVRVFGVGCGGTQTGSGFFTAPGIVVTNAHVVAGIDAVQVRDRRNRTGSATPILFDPNLDIAVLRVRGLSLEPRPILRRVVDRGFGGAVLGYPGGGPFTSGAAAVLGQFDAVGRDIYGSGLSRRSVYQLQAVVRPGNSGGPFVSAAGEVAGVVFAASTTDDDVGYAITGPSVAARVDQAMSATAEVDTGPCAA